jgi:ABC-type transport system substrate-binding protein
MLAGAISVNSHGFCFLHNEQKYVTHGLFVAWFSLMRSVHEIENFAWLYRGEWNLRASQKMSLASLCVLAALPCAAYFAQADLLESHAEYVKSVYSLPLTLDPILMNDTASLTAANLIYDGLLRFSPTLQIEGALAETWSTSADGKILTFVLRKNARFHDGTTVTANDVVGSLKRALSKRSQVRKYYDCIADNGLTAPDSTTVVIRLKHPFPPFLSVLAGATAKVLPYRLAEHAGFFRHPIGSGPFRYLKLAGPSPSREVVLARFESYYRGAPQLSRLILRESDEAQATRDAQNGTVQDLASWPLPAANPIFKTGQKVPSPVAATWIIGLNTKAAPFNSVQARRLFRRDVDTEGFRKRFFADAFPATGYVPPGLPGFNNRPNSVVPTTGRPPRARIKIVIPSELANAAEMQSFLQTGLRSKGWNVNVALMKWDTLMKGYGEKSHQAFLVSMNIDYPDAEFLLRNFESTNPDNFSGLKNAELDQTLRLARTLRDRKDRQALYAKALRLVDSEAVTVNLFHPRANYWISDCVNGFVPNILADIYIDYASISLRPGCGKKLGAL